MTQSDKKQSRGMEKCPPPKPSQGVSHSLPSEILERLGRSWGSPHAWNGIRPITFGSQETGYLSQQQNEAKILQLEESIVMAFSNINTPIKLLSRNT